MNTSKIIIVTSLIALISGGLGAFIYEEMMVKGNEALIKEFYAVENAVHVSPHSLRQKMSKGEFKSYVLVDLRSPQEYEKEHIVTAINIPAYKDPNTSAYEETDRIIGDFKKVIAENPGKDVIVYCYSIPCMTGRKIGQMLAENDIYVKHLNIGWNEWRYYWDLWNHDQENPTKPEDYVATGKEPGVPVGVTESSTCGTGRFGC